MSEQDSDGPQVYYLRAELEQPAKVEKIHVDGITRSKHDIIAKFAGPLLKVDTVEELLAECITVKNNMVGIGLFKTVKVDIDTSKGPSDHGYEVSFEVEEHSRFRSFFGTEFGTNEGFFRCQLGMPNTFGRAERLRAEILYGTKRSGGWWGLDTVALNLSKPINGNPNLLWSIGIAQPRDENPWSGYKELGRWLHTDVQFPSLLGSHMVQLNGVWRELSALNKEIDMSVREQMGHSMKSSVKHILSRDTRDHPIFPTQGHLVKLATEYAGLGGDAKFLKNDLQLQYNTSDRFYVTLQASLAGGCAIPLNEKSNLHISDRFYMGGPLTMRGFTINGCGPRSEGCSLGGNTHCFGALHLYSPLPFRAGKGGLSDFFRLHAWANAGNVVNNKGFNLQQLGRDLSQGFRCAAGAGIVARFSNLARIELNYCFPFKANSNDSTLSGWQFGIGVTYL